MSGIETQYFLGLFFTVWSLSKTPTGIVWDIVKLVAGLILLITAVLGFSLI